MKKVFLYMNVAALAVLFLCCTTACESAKGDEPPAATTPPTAPATPAPTVKTIGWGALTPSQRQDLIQIGESHPFGGTVTLDPQMTEIVSVTFIEDIPSSTTGQTLLEYKYSDGTRTGTNKILIKGHLENVKKVESIPDLLNNGACCFEYGGCIKGYQCSEPLPSPKKCAPCEKKEKKPCVPCQQGTVINEGGDNDVNTLNIPNSQRPVPQRP